MRIDLVLASAPVVERTEWCVIDRNARKGKQPSDHAPVIVDLPTDPERRSRTDGTTTQSLQSAPRAVLPTWGNARCSRPTAWSI